MHKLEAGRGSAGEGDIPEELATPRGPGASGAGAGAHLVECLSTIYKALGSMTAPRKPDVVVSTW